MSDHHFLDVIYSSDVTAYAVARQADLHGIEIAWMAPTNGWRCYVQWRGSEVAIETFSSYVENISGMRIIEGPDDEDWHPDPS